MVEKQAKMGELMKTGSNIEKRRSGRLQMVLTLCIVALGILVAFILIKLRKPPQRSEERILAPLVKVRQVNVRDIPMVVSGFGTVSPKVQVEVVPQVSGKVVAVNAEFKAGGYIPAAEELLKIDPRDYELAVQQAEAIVAEAEVALDLEKAEAQVARREWEELHPNTEPSSPLVVREPQIRRAQAKLESAKAQLATAELSLERTSLSLPIDARIISKRVDLGQYVMTGQSVGTAYGTDFVEIELPLEDAELAWFDIPDKRTSLGGAKLSEKKTIAEVRAEFGGAQHVWRGYVRRMTGQVDRTSRLVSVVVEVAEPFDTSESKAALLPGMFVEVLIEGKVLKNAAAVPRDAIRSGNEVWVVNDERLHIRTLEIVRDDKDFAYAVSGLEDGAMIVVSSLDAVTNGMRIRSQFGGRGSERQKQDGN